MLVRRIQMKTSTTPGELPTGLEHGEIAVNLVDRALFVGVDSAPPITISTPIPTTFDEGNLP
jgi:hypothetical protein